MPVIRSADAPIFTVPGFTFTGLAAPSRGASELCTWRLEIHPGASSAAHQLDHEEVFVLLDGAITVSINQEPVELHGGDAVVVPAHSLLQISNTADGSAHAVVSLPAGTQALSTDGQSITIPWAQ